MPLFASNFTSNSLSGTVRVSGGAANISLGIAPFALEGSKTFVVKLRRGSVVGDVIATSNPITINDFSQVLSLTANISTVAEGNLVSLSLVTANVPNNANVFYSVFPVTANVTASDFFGANAGTVTISNNQATFAFYANTDAGFVNEDGETFRVQLRTNSTTGNIVYTTANIVVTDFYKLFNAISLVESVSSVAEGVAVTFTFTGHNIPTGTLLYYDTVGNVTSFAANTGSFVMNGLSNTISITAIDIPAGQTLDYRLRVRKDSASGEILRTSNIVNVIDGAVTYATVSGINGNIFVANGYTTHVFTSSNTLTFTGVSGIPERNIIEYMVVAGGGAGGFLSGAGAGGMITGQFNLTSANLGTYTIQVGSGGTIPGGAPGSGLGGGTGSPSYIQNSGNTIHLSAMGGGGGGFTSYTSPGGSGGGGGAIGGPAGLGIPGQGNPGAAYPPPGQAAAGGGGAGAAGTSTAPGSPTGSVGGIGRVSNIALTTPGIYGQPNPAGRYFAGGGGGYTAAGGLGGGGKGSTGPGSMVAGNVNTGGGGGAGNSDQPSANWGGTGGSGIVIIRYISSAFYSQVVETSANLSPFPVANVTFSVTSLGANGLPLYYTTTGNVTINDIVGGNTGSFIITGSTTNVTLQANAIALNTTKNFQLQLRTGSIGGNVVLTSNTIVINGIRQGITALGGNVTTENGYVTHVFTTANTFSVTSLGASNTYSTIEYMVVAGGGGGGSARSGFYGQGGGGAGGLLRGNLTLSGLRNFNITIGGGGGGGSYAGPPSYTYNLPGAGGDSTFSNSTISFSVTATGGGRGGPAPGAVGGTPPGGSGGAAGNGIPGQGNPGYLGGGGAGGGAGEAGGILVGGAGRNFDTPTYWGDPGPGPGRYFAGGGSANGSGTPTPLPGGLGGGGGSGNVLITNNGLNGNVNTGGGGGGGNTGPGSVGQTADGGAGGSGIIVIRYPISAP